MRLVTIFSILAMLCLQGCTGAWVSVTANPITDSVSKSTYETNYQLNRKMTAAKGAVCVKMRSTVQITTPTFLAELEGKVTVVAALAESGRAQEKRTVVLEPGRYPLPDKLVYGESSATAESYFLLPVAVNGLRWGLLVGENGRIYDRAVYSYDRKMVWRPHSLSIRPDKVHLDSMSSVSYDRIADRNYDLIYNGRVENSLQLTIREYPTADPTSTPSEQPLFWDGAIGTFRFRNVTVIIHEATDEKIEYTVVSDGL